MKFLLGQVVMTKGVANFCEENNIGMDALGVLIGRHSRGDWGNVCEEDKQMNDDAVEHGNRVLSSYELNGEPVWIITEWDRSVTTILFPNEY